MSRLFLLQILHKVFGLLSTATDLMSPRTPSPLNQISPQHGLTYTLIYACIRYQSHSTLTRPVASSLIDGGANCGRSGYDVRVLVYSTGSADVTCIGDICIINLPLSTVVALITTHKGPIIGFFRQYVHYRKGNNTINLVSQMSHFGIHLTTPLATCLHLVQTPDDYLIPLYIRNGLPQMDMFLPTDGDLNIYPLVMFTVDLPCAPQ
jgi:hypothetical protein